MIKSDQIPAVKFIEIRVNMLGTTVNRTKSIVGNIKQIFASPLGIFIYAALSGMIGIVILLAFFSLFLSGSTLALIQPAIIAFNAANSGYCTVSKGGENLPRFRISLIAITVLLTLTGYFSIPVFSPWESISNGMCHLISGLSALIFSFFGAWIAIKSKKLNKKSPS